MILKRKHHFILKLVVVFFVNDGVIGESWHKQLIVSSERISDLLRLIH